jgi:hypothetical protein
VSDVSFDESWVVFGVVVVIVVGSITDVLILNEYSSGSMVVVVVVELLGEESSLTADSDGEGDPSGVLVDSSME